MTEKTERTVSMVITLPVSRAEVLQSAINSGSVGIMDTRDRLIEEEPESEAFLRRYYQDQLDELLKVWCQIYGTLREERGVPGSSAEVSS